MECAAAEFVEGKNRETTLATTNRCAHCAEPLAMGADFCEGCGAVIAYKEPASTAETVKQFVVIHEPGGIVRKVFLKFDEMRIGRAKGCQIILDHPRVSRHHATMMRTGNGVTIQDQRSANGTFVNDRPIHDRKHKLVPGDTCRLGRLPDDCVTMVYHELDEN
ncbi:MAG: FHA domain-containing protein [Planctomycetota bacterium]|jgi:hypothetical protein